MFRSRQVRLFCFHPDGRLRVPFDSRHPWREPYGCTSCVPFCSRQNGLCSPKKIDEIKGCPNPSPCFARFLTLLGKSGAAQLARSPAAPRAQTVLASPRFPLGAQREITGTRKIYSGLYIFPVRCSRASQVTEGIAQRGAAWMRRVVCRHRDVPSDNLLRFREAQGSPKGQVFGCNFFSYLFFGQAKKRYP